MAKEKTTKQGLKTIDIQGKPYVMVHDRLKFFREHYPDHSLISELILDAGGAIFKATILDANGRVLATGHAMEKEGGTFINKTSHIENAETSAWGRALANFGIGIDASVASADEVANAVKGQAKKPEHPMTKKLNRKSAGESLAEEAERLFNPADDKQENSTDAVVIGELLSAYADAQGKDKARTVLTECTLHVDGVGYESLKKLLADDKAGVIQPEAVAEIRSKVEERLS